MIKTITLPNGAANTFTAFSSEEIESLLQTLVMQLLGIIIPAANAAHTDLDAAYRQVRVSWQQDGQPTWEPTDDVCFIRAVTVQQPNFALQSITYNGTAIVQTSTSAWDCTASFYGPNSSVNAASIYAALHGEFVLPVLFAQGVSLKMPITAPQRVPEIFSQQTWQRSDLTFSLNASAITELQVGAIKSASGSITLSPTTVVEEF
jgi:hypothetical protein